MTFLRPFFGLGSSLSTLVSKAAASASPALLPVRGIKYRSSLRLLCNHCQFVRRKGKLRVICKATVKHKQVQG